MKVVLVIWFRGCDGTEKAGRWEGAQSSTRSHGEKVGRRERRERREGGKAHSRRPAHRFKRQPTQWPSWTSPVTCREACAAGRVAIAPQSDSRRASSASIRIPRSFGSRPTSGGADETVAGGTGAKASAKESKYRQTGRGRRTSFSVEASGAAAGAAEPKASAATVGGWRTLFFLRAVQGGSGGKRSGSAGDVRSRGTSAGFAPPRTVALLLSECGL